jgi:nitrate reductase molybdenum cofactor assembly chaperone NarJ/NarW
MAELDKHQEICRYFVTLLNYPNDEVKQTAAICYTRLKEFYPDTAEHLRSFIRFLEEEQASRVEEVFTATFDLQPHCYPYVGYQLCGENQHRTMFLIKLREIYRQHDFVAGNELPDHLCEVLRFVGMVADQECYHEIVQDGLLPTLEKILKSIEADDHPYGNLLNALQSFLTETVDDEPKMLAAGR